MLIDHRVLLHVNAHVPISDSTTKKILKRSHLDHRQWLLRSLRPL